MKVFKFIKLYLVFLAAFTISACTSDDDSAHPAIPLVHLQQGKDTATLRARAEREPHSILWEKVRQTCDSSLESASYNDAAYQPQSEKALAHIAESCALVGLVWQDSAAATKAKQALAQLRSDASSTEATADHAVVAVTIVHALNALSWWSHGPGFDSASESAFSALIGNLVQEYLDTWYGEQAAIAEEAQNAHNVLSAATTAYAALLLRGDARRDSWKATAYSDLWWFLQNPESGYLIEKGGAAEGPYFFATGQVAAMQFYQAKRQLDPEDETFEALCRTYNEECTAQTVTLQLPEVEESLHRTHLWLRTLRLPDGSLPPIDDSLIIANFTGAIAGDFFVDSSLVWGWANQDLQNLPTDTDPINLIYLPDWLPVDPPQQHPSESIVQSGHAAMRSSWDADATMMLVLGEGGNMLSPNHEHCDVSSFSIWGRGEALALDPGYVAESEEMLLEASGAAAHNMYLVDGSGPPERTSLWWDDTAAGEIISSEFDPRADYVAVQTEYNDARLIRHFLFDSENSFWIIDEIFSISGDVHEYTFNLHGAGAFDSYAEGATWTTDNAQLTASFSIVDDTQPYFDNHEFYHALFEDSATAITHMVLAVTAETDNVVFVSHLTVGDAGVEVDAIEYEYIDAGGYLHASWKEQRLTVRGPVAEEITFDLLDDVMIDERIVPGETVTTDARAILERIGSRTLTIGMSSWCDRGGCHVSNPENQEDYQECFIGICFHP
jgi:Heparinase II/III-like protein